MPTGVCRGCGKAIAVRDEAAARNTRCPACGGAVVLSGIPTAVPVATPVARKVGRANPPPEPEPGDEPQPRRPRSRRRDEEEPDEPAPRGPSIIGGALKGLALPFVFLFVIIVELGINALLGIRSSRSTILDIFFPPDAGLKMIFVALFALVLTIGGAVAGHAAAGTRGALIGGAVGYLIGGAGGGIFLELITLGRSRRS